MAARGLSLAVAAELLLVVVHAPQTAAALVAQHRLWSPWCFRSCAVGVVALRRVESSWIRDWTHVACIGRQILNHWATKKSFLLEKKWYHNIPIKDACFSSRSFLRLSVITENPDFSVFRWIYRDILAESLLPSSVYVLCFTRDLKSFYGQKSWP